MTQITEDRASTEASAPARTSSWQEWLDERQPGWRNRRSPSPIKKGPRGIGPISGLGVLFLAFSIAASPIFVMILVGTVVGIGSIVGLSLAVVSGDAKKLWHWQPRY